MCRYEKKLAGATIEPAYFQKKPYTYCYVIVKNGPFTLFGEGFAKCNPKDAYSEEMGKQIAYGRALKAAYEQG